MKKLLLLAAVACLGLSAGAQQTIKVTVEGQEIQNNATVQSYNINEEALAAGGGFQLDPEVMVTVSEEAEVTVTALNTTVDVSAPNLQLCFGGRCVQFEKGRSLTQKNVVAAGQATPLIFDTAPLYAGEQGRVPDYAFIATATITIAAAGLDSDFVFNIELLYNPGGAGVEGLVEESAAPVYYNLQGRKVTNPEKGIYVVKTGKEVKKVIL